MKDYFSVKEIADIWHVSQRSVQKQCSDGKISGAFKAGKKWMIPVTVRRPKDKRVKSGEYFNWRKNRMDDSEKKNGR